MLATDCSCHARHLILRLSASAWARGPPAQPVRKGSSGGEAVHQTGNGSSLPCTNAGAGPAPVPSTRPCQTGGRSAGRAPFAGPPAPRASLGFGLQDELAPIRGRRAFRMLERTASGRPGSGKLDTAARTGSGFDLLTSPGRQRISVTIVSSSYSDRERLEPCRQLRYQRAASPPLSRNWRSPSTCSAAWFSARAGAPNRSRSAAWNPSM